MVATETPAQTFDRYTGEVYAWAYRLLGRHHDALDVVQDVYLRWDEQCARERPAQVRGWLRQVTINRAIDMRRKRALVENPATVASNRDVAGSRSDEPADELDHERLRADIADAMDGLTDVQRTVLVAKIFDGLTFARIAQENGLAVSTAKTHYLRALRRVRDKLSPRWGTEDDSC